MAPVGGIQWTTRPPVTRVPVMPHRALRLLILAALLGGAAAGGWYATRPKPLEARLAGVERGTVERIVANTRAGTVKPCRRARLAPGIGGQIEHLNVHKGQRVQARALLLELWNDDLVAQVTLAQREAVAAQAKAEAACLNAAHAKREAARQRTLHARGVSSEDAVDKANTEASAQQADCTAAQASAPVEEARIAVAQAGLERTRLTAPFAGVVAEVNGELHEFVTPSPPGIPTPPAVDLIDDSCFYVSAPIDEVDAPQVALGQAVTVTLDAFGKRRFSGRVRRIAPYVLDLEKQARTVEVEVDLTGRPPPGELLAGYSADVEIVTDRHVGVLSIPTEAVLENDQVYLYDPAAGVIHKRKILKGLSNWTRTEVKSGLAQGDRVVVSLAQAGLADGVAVRPGPGPSAP
jgi:HlyD family secretion protein